VEQVDRGLKRRKPLASRGKRRKKGGDCHYTTIPHEGGNENHDCIKNRGGQKKKMPKGGGETLVKNGGPGRGNQLPEVGKIDSLLEKKNQCTPLERPSRIGKSRARKNVKGSLDKRKRKGLVQERRGNGLKTHGTEIGNRTSRGPCNEKSGLWLDGASRTRISRERVDREKFTGIGGKKGG